MFCKEGTDSAATSSGRSPSDGSHILVAYFSATGHTAPIAEYVSEILGADLYEIIAEDPYTEADLAYYTGGRCDQEQDDPAVRPAILGHVEHMEQYDIVLIGHPIWHGQAPRIISTFLESYDFSGKRWSRSVPRLPVVWAQAPKPCTDSSQRMQSGLKAEGPL